MLFAILQSGRAALIEEKESHAKTQKKLEKLEKQYEEAEKYIQELEDKEDVRKKHV